MAKLAARTRPARNAPAALARPVNPVGVRSRPTRTTVASADVSTPVRQQKPAASRRKPADPIFQFDSGVIDPSFMAAEEAIVAETGRDDILVASEVERRAVGIPLPSLSLAYLLASTVWPLARVSELYGQEGSLKSSLLFEIIRWHCLYDGYGIIGENENKLPEVLINSILGVQGNRVRITETSTLQEWQRVLTNWTARISAESEKLYGAYVYPVVYGIDSLWGTMSEGALAKIDKEGHSSRAFPEEALLISSYMKTTVSRFRARPWSLIFTNHLKPGSDAAGRPQDNVPGGKAVKFHATTRLKMVKLRATETTTHGGVRVEITTIKNSNGPGRRKIEADMVWRCIPDPDNPGVFKQETYWDWDAATIDMLISFTKTSKTVWNNINKIVDLRPQAMRRVSSKALGIPHDKPISYSKAGALLEARRDLVYQLYSVLMVSQHKHYRSGESYTKQRTADPVPFELLPELRYPPINHDALAFVTEALEEAKPEKADLDE